ncbi:Rv1535 family protein [Mycobacterium sp. Lab-001]|uniref:Rv1535 family protein n=1 Tax=Mycobacterium sp. Lab-001 TaxID=3410136 RepID=UPI003D17BC72
MTAVLYDEVARPAPVRALTVVRDTDAVVASERAKPARRPDSRPFGGDPLVDGAARLLSVPLRHLYAALWRVGVLEVRA